MTQAKLDAFREATRPSSEYGIVLTRATESNLASFANALFKVDMFKLIPPLAVEK